MGVVYKLKPEVVGYILEQKKISRLLSCRALSILAEEKFKIKVSKSSINSILKDACLSMPVGRRQKKRRFKPQPIEGQAVEVPKIEAKPLEELPESIPAPVIRKEEPAEIKFEPLQELECSGVILLKSMDYLMGGSLGLAEALLSQLNEARNHILPKIESLIYSNLFLAKEGNIEDVSALWPIIGRKINSSDFSLYLNELQSVKLTNVLLSRAMSNLSKEVRCVKVSISDSSILYLDAQFHTTWSTPHVPYDFSTSISNIKSYINKYFYSDSPFILFSAPGYDIPSSELFNFIQGLENRGKRIVELTFYGTNFEQLETISTRQVKERFYVIGLWPWQYVDYRKVKKIGEFKPFKFDALAKDFYAAEIEIELLQPDTNQSVTLKGHAIKTSLTEKTRLIVLSNLPEDRIQKYESLTLYLNHWPNLEEGFQDFSRKIEFSTYTGDSRRFFPMEKLDLMRNIPVDVKNIFYLYFQALDMYFQWYFFPLGYEDKDISAIKEQFYKIKVILKKQDKAILACFKPASDFPYLKELEYVFRRLNQREILFGNDQRLWFSY